MDFKKKKKKKILWIKKFRRDGVNKVKEMSSLGCFGMLMRVNLQERDGSCAAFPRHFSPRKIYQSRAGPRAAGDAVLLGNALKLTSGADRPTMGQAQGGCV